MPSSDGQIYFTFQECHESTSTKHRGMSLMHKRSPVPSRSIALSLSASHSQRIWPNEARGTATQWMTIAPRHSIAAILRMRRLRPHTSILPFPQLHPLHSTSTVASSSSVNASGKTRQRGRRTSGTGSGASNAGGRQTSAPQIVS